MRQRTEPEDEPDKDFFEYFRDENDETPLEKKSPSQSKSKSSATATPSSQTKEKPNKAIFGFGPFLQKWWTESLFPGMGLFGESYLLFSIGTLTPLWKELYPDCWDHQTEDDDFSEGDNYFYYSAYEIYASRNAASGDDCSPRLLESLTYGVVLGVIAGMVLLGYWSNHIGRRKGSILTASLMAGGSLGLVALSVLGSLFWSVENIFRGTVACLVLFGIGVGGEYPLSASLASEKATEELAKNQKVLAERKRKSYQRQAWTDQSVIDDAENRSSSGKQTQFLAKMSPKSISNNGSDHFRASNRGRRVQLVFAMQGLGIWFNSLTMLVLLWVLTGQSNDGNKGKNNDDGSGGGFEYNTTALLAVWRVTYGIGALVLTFVLLTRIRYLEESKIWLNANNSNAPSSIQTVDSSARHDVTNVNFHSNSDKQQQQQHPPKANTSRTYQNRFKLVHQQYGSRMFGAGMAWLLWDISFYGNKLFQSTFLLALVGENASLTELTGAAALNATVALLGYYGAAVLIDLPGVGRKSLQSIGLVSTGALFFACGWLSSSSSTGITVTLYLISSFMGQLGPNCTTFLIPAEIVPTDQRTYCHGVCAASGKIGALIAAIFFHFVGSADDGSSLFYLCGFAGVLGAVVTQIFVPETAGLDLLELDLQWSLLLGGEESYDGPAIDKDHLSLYERYRIGRIKGRSF